MSSLAETGDRLAAELRERGESDGQVDASVAVLGAMMFAYLNFLCADPDHPRFVPGAGYHQRVGTPSPDIVYRSSPIDGAGTYRLTGERGTVPQATLMPFGPPTASGVQTFPPFDLDTLTVGEDGRVDVILSAEKPADHRGDWWPLDPATRSLMLRSVSSDWGQHREPVLALVRLDAVPRRTRPSAAEVTERLDAFAAMVDRTLSYGLRRVDDLRAKGVVNDLTLVDYSTQGGLAAQWYHEGVFDLGEGDALLIEAEVPADCDSFSLSLTDPLFCTVDWVHAQSSLNHRQAVVDDDGVLRVVVAGSDPGVDNWLDTTGYHAGVVQCRWMGSTHPPATTVGVVPMTDVLARLPGPTATVAAESRTRRCATAPPGPSSAASGEPGSATSAARHLLATADPCRRGRRRGGRGPARR